MAGSLFVLFVLLDVSPADSRGGILEANYSSLRAPGQGPFGRKGEIRTGPARHPTVWNFSP
jgi:hypothetical protein